MTSRTVSLPPALGIAIAVAVAALLVPATASAQQDDSYPTVGIGGNMGFQTIGSGSGLFQIGMEVPIYLSEDLSIGPWLQVGFASETVNLLFTANTRYTFDLLERTALRDVKPYLQGGFGLAHTDVSGAGSTDFVMNMGLGIEVPISERTVIASDLMFSPILTRSAGSNFTFSWQFLTLRYRF